MTLQSMIEDGIPFNRKEKYFTGTILPAIIASNGFERLPKFLKMIDSDLENVKIKGDKDDCNILFYTEYNFYEAACVSERFSDYSLGRDTPDLLVNIRDKKNVLIAIEGKMYDTPSVNDLVVQMERQDEILQYIKNKLGMNKIYHVLLTPKKLNISIDCARCITWEDILQLYEDRNDYFTNMLRYAIDKYDDLVSEKSFSGFGKNCERKLTGEDILTDYETEKSIKVVGRHLGINGSYLEDDIKNGLWKKRLYECSTSTKIPNRNWFKVSDFIKRINELKAL